MYAPRTEDCAAESHSLQTSGCSSAPTPSFAVGHCAVCAGLRTSEHEFLAEVSDRPEDRTVAREAIVDAFGFCEQHGSTLLLHHGESPVLARILESATDCVLDLLSDEKRYADRLLELFFATDRTCPACKLHDHQVARHVHRLAGTNEWESAARGLCFPHYRDVAYTVKSAALPTLVDMQLKLLEAVVKEVGLIADESSLDAASLSISLEKVRWAICSVAGDASLVVDAMRFERSASTDETERGESSEEISDEEMACPVCVEIARAEERWYGMTKAAARLGQDLWTVFPTCPKHIWQCAQCDCQAVALLAARYAASVQLEALRRGIVALNRDNVNRQAATKSVFYRRKSPAYILGQQRKMVTTISRCPACERLVVAQERAIADALHRLRAARRRSAGEYFARLCLKHFASVYVHTMPGEARSWLVASQTEKLRELRVRLAQAGDGGDPPGLEHPLRQMMLAWRTVMW